MGVFESNWQLTCVCRAYVEKPNEDLEIVDLYDNGVNADTSAGDGIYSRYFTNVTYPGRYSVKCQVWDEGSAYVSYGFIGSSIFAFDGPRLFHFLLIHFVQDLIYAPMFRIIFINPVFSFDR